MILLPNGANMPSIGYGSWMTLLLDFSALLVICLPAAIAVDCNDSKGIHCQLLPNGAKLPAVGYGTWMSQDDALEKGLDAAFDAGYRHFDTAAAYNNEKTIGNALKKWLSSGKIKRDELFITTKLPPSGNRASDVEKFFKKSLEELQLDYVDLYLVHVPFTFKLVEGDLHPTDEEGNIMLDKTTDHVAVWKEMEKLVDSGKAKAIGLSNFNEKQIKRVLDNARIPPANLQVELHIHLQQTELVKFCKEHNITVTAYSPLGSPGLFANSNSGNTGQSPPSLLKAPEVIEIAKNHNKTAAQVILRYTVQRGIAVIPKSVTPSRIKENIDIFDFELTEEEMKSLKNLDHGEEGRLLKFDFFKGLKDHPEYPFQ